MRMAHFRDYSSKLVRSEGTWRERCDKATMYLRRALMQTAPILKVLDRLPTGAKTVVVLDGGSMRTKSAVPSSHVKCAQT